MTKLDLLITLQGKKLIWSGFDPETDGYVLLFDDGQAFIVTEFEPIDDFPSFAEELLSQELKDAKQVIALEAIVNPPEEILSEEEPITEEEKEHLVAILEAEEAEDELAGN